MPSSFPPTAFHAEPLVAVACPACFGAIAVGPDLLGQAAECPVCGRGFQVPLPGIADAPPRPAAADGTATQPARSRRKHLPDTTPEPPPDPAERPVTADPFAEPQPQAAPAAELQFAEPVRTVGSGDQAITLRRLTPEEKAVRRARRNLIMMLTGVSILMAIVLLLGTKRTRRRG